MPWYMYLAIAYLVIINVVSFFFYFNEGEAPSSRISALVLILLPIVGGSLGAAIANYFIDVEYKELRHWLAKILGYLPPIMFIIHFLIIVSSIGVGNCFSFVWDSAYASAGVIGRILVVVNIISFVLIVIRKSAYYIAPHGNYLIPDLILIPIIILGGATGALIAKLIFNFKEDWSCNALMEVQNFIYNWGMFLICGVHIALYIYFFAIR